MVKPTDSLPKSTILAPAPFNWKANPDRKVRTSYTSKIDLEKLRQDVLDYPDAYQRERATRFNCTDRAIAKALKRLKLTRKKSN